MRFSIQLFGMKDDEYVPLVTRADDLGYEAVWLADHVVTPLSFMKDYPYSDSGDPGYTPDTPLTDVTVMLGHLAADTERIRLGTGIYILPLRNPFHVARAWATVQNVSGGRALLGIGSGWMREEFDALGIPWRGRGARLDEMLDVIELLWSGESVDYRGEHFAFDPVRFSGPPADAVPLVFGGHADVALRRAGRRGDGWFGPNIPLERTVEYRDRLEAFREDAGRGDEPFAYYVRLHGDLDASNVRRYERAGFAYLVFSPFTQLPPQASLQDKLDALERVANDLDSVWEAP